jgi:hypothetical protein
MEIAVLDIKGQATGRTVVLDDQIFGIEPNEHAVWLDVKQYLATNVRVLTLQNTEAWYLVVRVNLKDRKEQVVLVAVASRAQYSAVVVEFSVQNHAITLSN